MRVFTKRSLLMVGAGIGVAALVVAPASGAKHDVFTENGVDANPRFGIQNNTFSEGLKASSVAWGGLPLTNPDTANGITHYGYNTIDGGPLTQDPHEAFKTEPDKNAYLVFGGKHYLYQGHEGGPRGYVTRINLDETDPTKQVTLISDMGDGGAALPNFDGVTWDPFTHQLLMTAEFAAPEGGVFAIDLDANGDPVDGVAHRLVGMGSGGFEGIQNDADGNVWIVEDIGGPAAGGGKKPFSFVYRFEPDDKTDLSQGGTLQALQLFRKDGSPITFAELQSDPTSADISALRTLGNSFKAKFIDIHSGNTTFDATAAAQAAGATPFKRPENGVFRPDTDFRQFFFTETGDTTATSTLPGAFGGVFRLKLSEDNPDRGRLAPFFVGDVEHTGLDNISFATRDDLLVVEDAGDSLHAQRNALDSGYALEVNGDHGDHGDRGKHGDEGPTPVRWLAEGRDASALYDATTSPGFNDGDNEITGIHTSDGDPTVGGILGAKRPTPFEHGWRIFWTQQHGDNTTWEMLPQQGD